MPWRSKTVEKLREEFALSAKNRTNFSALCREFGITRKTGYKWLKRYTESESLADKSRTPNLIANKTPEATERLVVALRKDNPGWGAKKIKAALEREGFNIPCVKTVNNILNRYGCIASEESDRHKPFIRFEKEHCNDMWQTDFKGEFKMADQKYCYPLNIFDDHSRFVIKTVPCSSTANVVIPAFRAAFWFYPITERNFQVSGKAIHNLKNGL